MTTTGDTRYEADIRWTTHGVAHVRADDWGGVGFGQGWACARDHLPVIADQIVKVRSERARYWGPGAHDAHVASDIGYLVLGVAARAGRLRDAQPSWVREMVSGYVAGYNRRATEVVATGSLPQWCAGAEWVRPIDELDFYAYLGDVALLASGRNLAQLLGRAEAPGPDGPVPPSPAEAFGGPAGASNGWAVGGDVTASGHGMVLANPHFPWYGEARFWECHLTIPGELDVYGVSLLGVPGVQIGFTAGVAWAHTFSWGHRFTLNRLDLAPGRPTSYRHGDAVRDMTPTTHRIEVLGEGGALEALERTTWTTHHGPMVNLPLIGWGMDLGFCYRDANIDNDGTIAQFLGMDRARDLDEFRGVFHETKGMPWVNTMAADRSGRVWYADFSATPRLSSGAQRRFRRRLAEDPIAQFLMQNRVALLDGSDPDDDWLDHPDARSPGIEPPSAMPELERRDFVINSNDSHWLSNPSAPLEGYSVLCGLERTGRSLRTRQNTRQIEALAARGSVTVHDLLAALFSNESLSAELLLDDVVGRCRTAQRITLDGSDLDLTRAADVLERWDRRVGLDSVGASLWREFMAGYKVGMDDSAWREAGPLFAVPFDPDAPIETPRSLVTAPAEGEDPVATSMGRALQALDRAGVDIGAPLGDVQWAVRGDARIPLAGGGEAEGVMNVAWPIETLQRLSLEPAPTPPAAVPGREVSSGLGEGGYQIRYGASFIMAVELTDEGPIGLGLLAYGQTSDPSSPHHRDGMLAFAAGAVRPLLFADADIDADPVLVRQHLISTHEET